MNYGKYGSEILYEERPYEIMNLVQLFFECGTWGSVVVKALRH